ncbi:hypothetical protein JOF56_001396 [Kibdelosporangium banguiense]|uniref:Antitoxin VapB n=1 Tax=Kibdelosporangium banguiense TaxID=1365924 RepID=A0ABS4TAY6_9PSEU|nr:hypothetical protein [Kibdelosporangium banguiense]MBP2321011.1 hypothetical protein [Kibdelosporangium banguiense]
MGRELSDEERRRKLDEVFGDVLPETTKDEREPDPEQEDWYLRNKPPHHG